MKFNETFKSHQALMRKYSWNVSRAFRADFSSVLSDANLIFMKAIEKFDESRGIKFSTYLTCKLRGLWSPRGKYAAAFRQSIRTSIISEEEGLENNPRILELCAQKTLSFTRTVEFKDLIDRALSEDAREVVSLILFTSKRWKLAEMKNYLKEKLYWTFARTNRAWQEIKVLWRSFDSSALTL